MSDSDPQFEVHGGANVPDVMVEAQRLIDGFLNGALGEGEAERLRELVCEHGAVARLYVLYVHQECIIAAHSASDHASSGYADLSATDSHAALDSGDTLILAALHEVDNGLEAAPSDATPPPLPDQPTPALASGWTRGRVIGLAAGMVLAVTATLLLVRTAGQSGSTVAVGPGSTGTVKLPALATIAGTHNAHWGGPGVNATPGAPLPTSELTLESGLVQLTFMSGASVILEGPARFTVDHGNGLSLAAGTLAAVVPEAARGFTVLTASGRVTDLGTEFGVRQAADGAANVEIFKGSVQATAGDATLPHLLVAGEAAKMAAGKVTPDVNGAVPQRFVRTLMSGATSLDVTDLVAGGDGTTGRRRVAIDARNGEVGLTQAIGEFAGDGLYHRVIPLPVIDGVFLSNAEKPTIVDSAGHTFQFPPTSGSGYQHIWAGGKIPWEGIPGEQFTTKLGDTDYGAPGHGFVLTHANGGITLDLDVVRRLHTGCLPTRFHGVVGNSHEGFNDLVPKTDVHVIIDGQARFTRAGFTHADGPIPFDLPIGPNDRFLTLVATDAGDKTRGDWVIWGDPTLALTTR